MKYNLDNPRQWRPVKVPDKTQCDYDGLYEVHRSGVFREIETGNIFKGHNHPCGYLTVSLTSSCGKRKMHLAHRLVAFAWVKNKKPDMYRIVNHEDGNKQNNRDSNLVWCNNSQNILHARRLGLNPYNRPGLGQKFGSTSIYHGVGFDKGKWKWYAGVTLDNKCVGRKRFDTEIEAALYFNELCDQLNLTDRARNEIIEERSWKLIFPNGNHILCSSRGIRIRTLAWH